MLFDDSSSFSSGYFGLNSNNFAPEKGSYYITLHKTEPAPTWQGLKCLQLMWSRRVLFRERKTFSRQPLVWLLSASVSLGGTGGCLIKAISYIGLQGVTFWDYVAAAIFDVLFSDHGNKSGDITARADGHYRVKRLTFPWLSTSVGGNRNKLLNIFSCVSSCMRRPADPGVLAAERPCWGLLFAKPLTIVEWCESAPLFTDKIKLLPFLHPEWPISTCMLHNFPGPVHQTLRWGACVQATGQNGPWSHATKGVESGGSLLARVCWLICRTRHIHVCERNGT